jgi:hypothetical protein
MTPPRAIREPFLTDRCLWVRRTVVTTINVAQFVDAVNNWAAGRDSSFKYYWPVKGGWEGWIQVDLTAFILSKLPTLEILREQPIYKNDRQKVDLLINADEDPDDQIAVELKAQSFENRAAFIKQVVNDLDKLAGVNRAYANTTSLVLASTFNQATLDELLGLEMDDHPVFRTVFGSTELVFAMAEWNAQQGWVDPTARTGAARTRAPRSGRPGSPTTGFGPEAAFTGGGALNRGSLRDADLVRP